MAEFLYTLIGAQTITCRAEELPFTENGILKGCIYYFDDPHPCFIHRSAVQARLIGELEEYISAHCCTFPAEISPVDLPELVAESLNIPDLKKIQVTKSRGETDTHRGEKKRT